jgi:competence protein ComEC
MTAALHRSHGRLAGLRTALSAGLDAFAEANQERRALWLTVLFGAGIGLYFALPAEPDPRIAAGLVAAAIGLAVLVRKRSRPFAACLCLVAAAAGFGAANLRTVSVAAPVLERRVGPVWIEGRILRAETGEAGVRLLLTGIASERLRPGTVPDRVRITVRTVPEPLHSGQRVRVLAVLQPPPEPSIPGGYDFARKAWFERVGGVGFALGAARPQDEAMGGGLAGRLSRLREDLTRRIVEAAGPAVGPTAAALMTGERRAIPEETLADMRDSGLAHLLAISGLHIGLLTGLLFFGVRFALAAIEPVALRWPIKKIAAVAALGGAFAYLLISGATVPTQRAFVMTAIVLFAVLIDRTAISMRLVAIAAAVVLAVAPESLLEAGFQMSFAAVVALVAVYEVAAPRLAALRRDAGLPGGRVGAFVAATLLTSLVAGLATAPYAAYHFNRLALLGLAANMIAVPLMAAWIMPWAIVSFLLMPFGLEEVGLVPMGWGIEAVLAVASYVAALPGAAALVPPLPTAGLVLITVGGLWLCLWRARARLAGVFLLLAGSASVALVPPPDLVIGGDGELVAVRRTDGAVAINEARGKAFERDLWLRRLAVRGPADWPDAGLGPSGTIGCDGAGCIVRLGTGRTVALVRDTAAAEDCSRADYAVLLTRMPRRLCRGAEVVVDSYRLWRDGAHAVRFAPDGPVVDTVRAHRGDRPWSRSPARRSR